MISRTPKNMMMTSRRDRPSYLWLGWVDYLRTQTGYVRCIEHMIKQVFLAVFVRIDTQEVPKPVGTERFNRSYFQSSM